MTKFEEEVKRPANGPLTELNNNMQEVFSQYRKMRQYADYLEYELKQKDEHILKLENENSFMRDERTTFDSNGMAVEPKIQQQSLPVVPECVAEWIEYVKGKDNNVTALLTDFDNMPEDVDEWLFLQSNDDNINLILRAWLDGYTVEKQQLFYLKNKLTNSYLCQYPSDKSFYHLSVDGDRVGKLVTKYTQEEIDSMQTGSYEQIEVAE